MDRHFRNYELLGISPGDSWQKLRDGYKSAVRKWHPDRFTTNDLEREIAEEKTKEINRAYQELQDYFQQQGCMPLDRPRPVPPQSDDMVTVDTSPREHPTKTSAPHQRTWVPTNGDGQKEGAGRRLRLSLILLTLVVAAYYLFFPHANELPQGNQHPGSSTATSSTQPEQTSPNVTKKHFTTGSSLGEVHSVQGIPSKIEGNTWYYGDAKVVFLNGKVAHWVDSADHSLLALSGQEPLTQESVMQYFSKGSTKTEVMAIQGAPLRETPNAWDYGLSRIYFERDKVVGWQESPLEPLRIKR